MAKQVVLWIAVPLFLVGLAGGGAFWALRAFDPCSQEIIDSQVSPNGDWTAVVYTRNCGATARTSSNVSLVPSGQKIDGAGNVFAAYETEISIEWDESAALALTIRLGPVTEVFRREASHEGVTVRYD